MKAAIFTFFMFLSYLAIGQGLNTELGFNDNYSQSSEGIVCLNEYTYLVKTQNNSSSFITQSVLCKLDTLGNILWSTVVNPKWAETTYVYEILASDDGGIYLLGLGRPICDVAGGWFWYIQKYDSYGNAIWTRIWDEKYFNEKKLTGLSNNSIHQLCVNYVDSSGSYISHFGIDGNTIDSLKITPSKISGFEDFSINKKVGFKSDTLWVFDNSGNVEFTVLFNDSIQNIKSLNDTLFVLTRDSIYSFNNNLQIIRGTDIIGFSNYSHLKIINGNIYFVSNGFIAQDIIQMNRQLQLLEIKTIPIGLTIDTDKDFNASHFSTAINFSLTRFTAIRYLDYSLNSNQNELVNSSDIGIIDLVPTYVNAEEQPNFQHVYRVKLEATALIKNYGSNILNSCRINHFITSSTICNDVVFTKQFENLNLAPGDSIWIPLGLMHEALNYFSDSVIKMNICVYTSFPNSKTDLNTSNDNYCEDVVFGYEGISNSELVNFLLFPNPTTGLITLNLPVEQNSSFSIFNIQGEKIMEGNIKSNKLDITSLSNGMYFLMISTTNHQTYIKNKIVKY